MRRVAIRRVSCASGSQSTSAYARRLARRPAAVWRVGSYSTGDCAEKSCQYDARRAVAGRIAEELADVKTAVDLR